MPRKRGSHRQAGIHVEHSGNRREGNREGRRPRLGEVGSLPCSVEELESPEWTQTVGSAGYLQLFPSQSPESASLRGCSALFLRSLHIPHILYAQLRRNNQGSKQGHSSPAMPLHHQDHMRRNSLPPESQAGKATDQKGLQGEESKHPVAGYPSALHKTEGGKDGG